MQSGRSLTAALPRRQAFAPPPELELLPNGIHRTEHLAYAHHDTSRSG
jgi:hypothetical protein